MTDVTVQFAVAGLVIVLAVGWAVTWHLYADANARRITAENTLARQRSTSAVTAFSDPRRCGPPWSAAARPQHQALIPAPQPLPPTQETTVFPNQPRRLRIPLAVAVTIAVAAVAAGCWPQPGTLDPTQCGADRAPDAYLFGDSLSAMARRQACDQFTADDVSVSYNAVGGTQLDQWHDAMANVPDGAVVVVELGTNDVTLDLMADMIVDLHEVLETLAGARCVIVPTLNTTGGDLRGWPYDVRTQAFNAELVRLLGAGTYPNLRVYPWHAESTDPDLLQGEASNPPDWVHYNTSGTGVFAGMLADAVEACG